MIDAGMIVLVLAVMFAGGWVIGPKLERWMFGDEG